MWPFLASSTGRVLQLNVPRHAATLAVNKALTPTPAAHSELTPDTATLRINARRASARAISPKGIV